MSQENTIAERIRNRFENLTRAERQLANAILENYPASGLSNITSMSQASGVSTPTIVRMAKKLGFSGFANMQEEMRHEVEAKIANPIVRHERWIENAPDAHLLNRFGDAVMANMRQTLSQIDPNEFDIIAKLIADKSRHVHIVGGRITNSLASYLYTHLQMIRSGLTLISSNVNTWPHYALNLSQNDILIVFDIRRYEREISRLSEIANAQNLKIILITDQWGSPVTKFASHTIHARIEAPSAWDSNVVLLMMIETIIAAVQDEHWDETKSRMVELEKMFDRTKLFKKFT